MMTLTPVRNLQKRMKSVPAHATPTEKAVDQISIVHRYPIFQLIVKKTDYIMLVRWVVELTSA